MSARITKRQKAVIDEQIRLANGRQLYVVFIEGPFHFSLCICRSNPPGAPIENAKVIQGYFYADSESHEKQLAKARQKKSLVEQYVTFEQAAQ